MSKLSRSVKEYYESKGSRLGYRIILGGTKHFGFYQKGDSPWLFSAAMRRMEGKLASKLSLPLQSLVLDAGCGMGDVASYLASNGGLRVHGIDILEFNIDEADRRKVRRRLSERVSFEIMDYSALSLPEASFDGAYTMETLVHAEDSSRVLSEIYKVLKPGGKLVLFEYSHDALSIMSGSARQSLRSVNQLASMPSFQKFEHGVLEAELQQVGFIDLETEDITTNMLPMVRAFYLLARVPYFVTKALGRPTTFVNAMSAVELWKIVCHLKYSIHTVTKPL